MDNVINAPGYRPLPTRTDNHSATLRSSFERLDFINSPQLRTERMNAILDAHAANHPLTRQAIDSERVRSGLTDVLLGPGQLYEALRMLSDLTRHRM